jgi:hypothetical protein
LFSFAICARGGESAAQRGSGAMTSSLPRTVMKPFRSLDDWLPAVFVAFALLSASTLWLEAVPPQSTSTSTQGA